MYIFDENLGKHRKATEEDFERLKTREEGHVLPKTVEERIDDLEKAFSAILKMVGGK